MPLPLPLIDGWFPPPRGLAEVRKTFGEIVVDGGIVVAPKLWESNNVSRVKLPGQPNRGLYSHNKIHPMLVELFGRWLEVGFSPRRVGCFAPRGKRSNPQRYSLHSWAIAIDIDADDNPAHVIAAGTDTSKFKRAITDEQVAVAESIGWVWGGRFKTYWDSMHFQWAAGI